MDFYSPAPIETLKLPDDIRLMIQNETSLERLMEELTIPAEAAGLVGFLVNTGQLASR